MISETGRSVSGPCSPPSYIMRGGQRLSQGCLHYSSFGNSVIYPFWQGDTLVCSLQIRVLESGIGTNSGSAIYKHSDLGQVI